MFINKQTLETYRNEYFLRAAMVDMSLPAEITDDVLSGIGVARIAETPMPAFDPIRQRVDELAPVKSGGSWNRAWGVTNLSTEQASANLTSAKTAKRLEINAWRLQANRGTFTHGGKLFTCDELSRSDIDGITSYVTLCNSLPPGWPGGWKSIDNTYLTISTVDEWRQFVASMVASGSANFEHSQVLKAQLELCTTQAQIDAIKW